MMRRPNPWLAALLSLLGGPLGQIYDGRFRRSLTLWFIGFCATCTLFLIVTSLELSQLAFFVLVAGAAAYPVFLAVDAFVIARRVDGATRKWYQRWWMYIAMFFVFCLLNFLTANVVKIYIAEVFVVPGRAMVPTILHMDRILVDKLPSNAEALSRNDIVVFRMAGKDSPLLIMRVLGLPGETIEIKNRIVYIDNKKWDDVYALHNGEPPDERFTNFGPLTISQSSFFVLGDNRFFAVDSRTLGEIPFANFYGRAKKILWSRDYEFPIESDLLTGVPKAIRWDRIGTNVR